MDEVDLDALLKEASEAMDDAEDFAQFLREKATIAIERFLVRSVMTATGKILSKSLTLNPFPILTQNYLPKMSIPVEKRDLGGDMQGWVITCRGADGGDLSLSDVSVRSENLICQVLGGDAIFFPMFGDEETDVASISSVAVEAVPREAPSGCVEESVLDEIREMLQQAQRHGCWKSGVGGVAQVSV